MLRRFSIVLSPPPNPRAVSLETILFTHSAVQARPGRAGRSVCRMIPRIAGFSGKIMGQIKAIGARFDATWEDRALETAAPEGAEVECHHYRVVGRDIAAIGVIGEIVEPQDEAVVDVAEAEPRLVELAGREIVAGTAIYHPILADLEGFGREDAFAPGEESELGLRGIVAEHDRAGPAVERRARLDLETLQAEIGLVEAEPGGEGVDSVGLIGQTRDIVGGRLVEAASEAGVGEIADRERGHSEQLVGLAEQGGDVA